MNIPNFITGTAGQIEYDYIQGHAVEKVVHQAQENTNGMHDVVIPNNQSLLALVCHPHPVYSGTKDNKVVHTLCRAFRDLAIDSIRFNFRGVGESEGSFDDGKGEYQDLCSVIEFVANYYPSKTKLVLAGFSFGSSIALKAAIAADENKNGQSLSIELLILVAPPVMYSDFAPADSLKLPTLVVHGDEDEVVPIDQVSLWASAAKQKKEDGTVLLQYQIIKGTTHFFHRRLGDLKEVVQLFLTKELGA